MITLSLSVLIHLFTPASLFPPRRHSFQARSLMPADDLIHFTLSGMIHPLFFFCVKCQSRVFDANFNSFVKFIRNKCTETFIIFLSRKLFLDPQTLQLLVFHIHTVVIGQLINDDSLCLVILFLLDIT